MFVLSKGLDTESITLDTKEREGKRHTERWLILTERERELLLKQRFEPTVFLS